MGEARLERDESARFFGFNGQDCDFDCTKIHKTEMCYLVGTLVVSLNHKLTIHLYFNMFKKNYVVIKNVRQPNEMVNFFIDAHRVLRIKITH